MNSRCLWVAAALTLAIGLGASAEGRAEPTPAERRIAQANAAIAADPSRAEPYAELALALARRARETADTRWYDKAGDAVEEAKQRDPGNLAAERAAVWVLLGRHEFAQAVERAQELNRKAPDELLPYAFLVDANAELGNYAAAEEAAQWLLDLRPGNIAGLTRAAYLRELFGDVEGALELMASAYHRTPPTQAEDRAWILTQMAHLELSRGRVDTADKLADAALGEFSDYHYALGVLAEVRASQARLHEAADLQRRRYRAAPHPETLYALAVTLKRAGKSREGQRLLLEFEARARAESARWDNANRELVLCQVDHTARPREALAIARIEIARRRDVFTRDVFAWALYANGRYPEARDQIEQALGVGIRNAGMFYRAGMIALRQHDRSAAKRYLRLSLETNPYSEYAQAARRAIAQVH
jgi:tetratricopeptide (TPR) repeat protein